MFGLVELREQVCAVENENGAAVDGKVNCFQRPEALLMRTFLVSASKLEFRRRECEAWIRYPCENAEVASCRSQHCRRQG